MGLIIGDLDQIRISLLMVQENYKSDQDQRKAQNKTSKFSWMFRHVNATKSYLHFCCFAGEVILCFKPYF